MTGYTGGVNEQLHTSSRSGQDWRIGHGFDLHRLDPLVPDGQGKPLILAGVKLAHPRGPVGHSDGDALYHAVTDAVLGALALPDIGELFPDTDARHAGRDSAEFLAEAVRRANVAGWVVVNLDATVVMERPKISPHKQRMRDNLALLLGVHVDRVNVKGKTHEGVDAVGRGEAVEVHVVVLLGRA